MSATDPSAVLGPDAPPTGSEAAHETLRFVTELRERHPLAIDGSIFGWAAGEVETTEVLDAFHAGGGRMISTADHYAGGRSEVMIGRWIASRGVRDDVLVATKVGRHPDARGLSERAILTAVNSSLRRLGTDRIDLLSFDGDHPADPIDVSLETVDALIRAGKVRRLSASGYSGRRMTEVTRLATTAAYPRFAAAVAEYSLMRRDEFESDLAPVLEREGIAGIARFPLASGYLDGRHRSREALPSSPMFMGAAEHVGRRGNRVLDVLGRIAAEHGVAMASIAIAWVLSRRGVTTAMVRARSADQVVEFLDAASVRLTRQQVGALDRVSS